MTIKVTRDKQCCPDEFVPYTINVTIDNYEDHLAFNYLAMCNAKVPQALYERASDSYLGSKYRVRAAEIRSRSKAFLLTLAGEIPKRSDC